MGWFSRSAERNKSGQMTLEIAFGANANRRMWPKTGFERHSLPLFHCRRCSTPLMPTVSEHKTHPICIYRIIIIQKVKKKENEPSPYTSIGTATESICQCATIGNVEILSCRMSNCVWIMIKCERWKTKLLELNFMEIFICLHCVCVCVCVQAVRWPRTAIGVR